MPHSQELVLIPISLRSILILSSHLRLGLPNSFFPVGLPAKILKALLPSFIMATWPVHLNLPDVITLTLLGEWYYEIPHYGVFSTLHSHPPWAQIFASRSYFQTPTVWCFRKTCFNDNRLYDKENGNNCIRSMCKLNIHLTL